MSLAHPDWVLSDFAYKPETVLTFNLASRASGANVTCKYLYGLQDILTCSPHPNSKFALKFRPSDRRLFIQENWVCGDIEGSYSTNFTAVGDASIASNSSTTTTTTIKGP